MAKTDTNPPRGTRDFFPEDMRLRNWLFAHFREVSRRFGFEEVDAPIVEHADLFIRKAGEEIVEQLYHFELHDRHLALRPEFTPSLARMVQQRAGSARFPLRWFSIPQCWRYERMTRGRRREHYQWNCDIWGEAGPAAEAELIAALFSALDAMGLPADAVRMRLNSRALLEESLRREILAARPEAFAPLCVIIDKLDKIGPDAVMDQLCAPDGAVALSRSAAEDCVAMLSARSLAEVASAAPKDSAALAALHQLFELLDAYGLVDRVQFDASVVRGLAYYTGIVFEAFDSTGSLRAIAGGGRYDRLLETLGGKSLPAAGFGFGDAVITELLRDRGLLPELPHRIDGYVLALGASEQIAAARLAHQLRCDGQSIELALAPMRVKKALGEADRAGAKTLYVVGEDELARGVARARDLATREERDVPLPPTGS
ncbi:MAG: histidine--tRNA ligase [Myxococcales bacterium]|nr:histidine--tRNA ligase [Myxococcales bacterium]